MIISLIPSIAVRLTVIFYTYLVFFFMDAITQPITATIINTGTSANITYWVSFKPSATDMHLNI